MRFLASFFRAPSVLLVLAALLLTVLPAATWAQGARTKPDSARMARQRGADSLRTVRNASLAVLKKAQKSKADSLATVRAYRTSKRYTDSVTRARNTRLADGRAALKSRADSFRVARQQSTDSLAALRSGATTALKATQKKRTDSLTAIRTYRTSKRYADSVAVVRKSRSDSLRIARKAFADSATAARKSVASAATAERKAKATALMTVRKAFTDSLKAVRKVKADSLATVRTAREKAAKQRETARTQKLELALNLKISKKREKWSNETMLKKRWAPPRKQMQNLFTHFNYYFNANRKMDEAVANMLRARRDGYDTLLALFPYNPDLDSNLLKPDMDSIIQKTSVGIQIHDPRTDWGDDLYLLLGQAFYYKADYDNASTAFRYIVSLRDLQKKKPSNASTPSRGKAPPSIVAAEKKGPLEFLKREPAHNEALLWLARTYTQSRRYGDAESVLDLLIADPAFPASLKGRFALERAYLALSQRNYSAATPYLVEVTDDKSQPVWLRQRAGYLSGQLLQEEGQYAKAADQYQYVSDLHPKIDLDFYARRNRAYSLMAAGGDQAEAVASLRSMLKDGKYAPYYEQVYYVMGRLSANSGQTPQAIEYLAKSIGSVKSTRRQRALSFAALGDVFYGTGAYEQAQSAYDSAAYLAGRNGATDPIFAAAAKRAKTLTAVALPARTLHLQDSLLALAALSDKEQRAVARRAIRAMAARQADSAARADAGAGVASNEGQDAGPGGGAEWYFASTTTLRQGYNDFKRKWGNRPAADNWRRASAASFASTNTPTTQDTTQPDLNATAADGSGLPTEETLLAGVPRSAEQQETARQKVRRAYVDLATAYTKQLEDYARATKSLDDLDRRFPGHEYQAEALYLGYLIFLRQNQIERAQSYAAQLLEKYPTTSWAALVRPADDDASGPLLASAAEAAGYYEETYSLVQQRQFDAALRRSREGQRRWTQPRIADRFRILEAMSLAGSGSYDRADTVLTTFLTATSSDSLRAWAETLKAYVNRTRPAAAPATDSTNRVGAATPTAPGPGTLTPAGTAAAPSPGTPAAPAPVPAGAAPTAAPTQTAPAPTSVAVPATYTYKASDPHLFVFLFPKMEPRAMGVKAGVTDLNSLQFGGQNLQASVEMLSGQQGFVVVKPFANAAKAKAYLTAFRAAPTLLREYTPGDKAEAFIISEANFQKLLADRTAGPYLQFYRKKY